MNKNEDDKEKKGNAMDERQIELLKKALDLYDFTIDQRHNQVESNEFFYMREALSKILNVSLYSD